jgi:hypothetical protein
MKLQEMQLKEMALDIKAKALSQGEQGKPITLDYPNFSISGDPMNVAEVADLVAQYPDQVNHPGFMPFIAQRGISFKQREQKAVEPPKTRTRQMGDQEITEEWNGKEWVKVGGGPKWNPKSDEFEVSTDKEGNVTVRKGPAGAAGGPQMTKPTQTKIEGKLFDSTNALSRLQSIEQAFKPEYMTWKTKLGQQVTSWKSKAGIEVSPEDKAKRTEFAQFQRRAMSNLNAYLNELSGAAITEQEAKRLTQAMPDALKDDPIEFESKMRDVMEELKLSITRYNYLLANGWTEQQIIGNVKKNQIQSVGSFRSQIQARAKEIEQELKASGTDERDIRNMVTERLRQEFKL